MPKVRVEGRDEVYRFPDDTPREEIARQLRNYLFPRRPQQSTADTVAQTGSVAGFFAPGSGLADAIGIYPTGEGTSYPSMMENILSGNFADAGYQALGVVGDLSYATAPITGPIGVGIGMAAKAPRAARLVPRIARNATESARIDNPGGEWLAEHITDAEAAYSRGRRYRVSGATTANWRGRLGIDAVRDLPGLNDEHLRIRPDDERVTELARSMTERGFDEDSAVFLNVNHRGEVFVNEGNHRIRAAEMAGLDEIPVHVRYFSGGEAVDGPFRIVEAGDDAANAGTRVVGRLPMDEQSRLTRAQEQGYDTSQVWYRGTTEQGAEEAAHSFEAGRGVFLSDNPDVAEIFRYPREYGDVLWDETPGDLQELYTRAKSPLELTGREAQLFTEDTAFQSRTLRQAIEQGHDSVIVRNVREGVGDNTELGTTLVVLDPSMVRKTTARFDPDARHTPKLLGGVAAGAIGLGLLQDTDEKDGQLR